MTTFTVVRCKTYLFSPAPNVDNIVIPVFQRSVSKCKAYQIRDIQLFSAKDKSAFYEKAGFEKRPADAPGMQIKF